MSEHGQSPCTGLARASDSRVHVTGIRSARLVAGCLFSMLGEKQKEKDALGEQNGDTVAISLCGVDSSR